MRGSPTSAPLRAMSLLCVVHREEKGDDDEKAEEAAHVYFSTFFLEQLQSLFKRTSEPVWVGSGGGELGGATGKEVSAPKRAER